MKGCCFFDSITNPHSLDSAGVVDGSDQGKEVDVLSIPCILCSSSAKPEPFSLNAEDQDYARSWRNRLEGGI
jgi:hypothetical protein